MKKLAHSLLFIYIVAVSIEIWFVIFEYPYKPTCHQLPVNHTSEHIFKIFRPGEKGIDLWFVLDPKVIGTGPFNMCIGGLPHTMSSYSFKVIEPKIVERGCYINDEKPPNPNEGKELNVEVPSFKATNYELFKLDGSEIDHESFKTPFTVSSDDGIWGIHTSDGYFPEPYLLRVVLYPAKQDDDWFKEPKDFRRIFLIIWEEYPE